jgi:hypothetical protein
VTADARSQLSALSQLLLPFAIRGLATLGVADRLAESERDVTELADDLGANAEALHRTLRFTASRGVFTEVSEGRYALSPMAEYLRSDTPGTLLYSLLITDTTRLSLDVFSEIVHTLHTGEPAYRKVVGTDPFTGMSASPQDTSIFSAQMRERSRAIADGVLAAYDFSAVSTLVDVGGGTGMLISRILAAHPGINGTLMDLRAVVDEAHTVLTELDVVDRCTTIAGDMFDAVPPGAQMYLLSSVLHDWPDERARRILDIIRHACDADTRLVVIEMVLSDHNTDADRRAKQLDFAMLMSGGGRERTRDEFARLLGDTGWQLTRVVPTTTAFTILEAHAV